MCNVHSLFVHFKKHQHPTIKENWTKINYNFTVFVSLLLFLHSRISTLTHANDQWGDECAANADKSHELISLKCGIYADHKLAFDWQCRLSTADHGPIVNTIAFSFDRSIFNAIKTIRIDTFAQFSASTSIGSINFASAWSHFSQQYIYKWCIN